MITPMDIILFLGIITIAWIISSLFPKYSFEPTKKYDSPKDAEYYEIGAKLNQYTEENENVFIISDDLKDILSISWNVSTREVSDVAYIEK